MNLLLEPWKLNFQRKIRRIALYCALIFPICRPIPSMGMGDVRFLFSPSPWKWNGKWESSRKYMLNLCHLIRSFPQCVHLLQAGYEWYYFSSQSPPLKGNVRNSITKFCLICVFLFILPVSASSISSNFVTYNIITRGYGKKPEKNKSK